MSLQLCFCSQNNARKRDYSAKPWDEFFESQKQIVIANNKFQYYESGAHSDEVLVLFLHGGGFSGLSWAVLTVSQLNNTPVSSSLLSD